VDVPQELHQRLLEEATRAGLTVSDLVRAAIKTRLAQNGNSAGAANFEQLDRTILRELRKLRFAAEEGAFAARVAAETVAAHFQHTLATSPEAGSDKEKDEQLARGQRRWQKVISAVREMLQQGEYLHNFAKARPVGADDFPAVPAEVLAKLSGEVK
jgi:leucyl aminopeptidase (aminopeptidase T)